MLVKILTFHVVPGKLNAAMLKKQIAEGGGKATLKTVEGESLTVTSSGDMLMVTDQKEGMAHITITDVTQSNGVILVVDKVLLPA